MIDLYGSASSFHTNRITVPQHLNKTRAIRNRLAHIMLLLCRSPLELRSRNLRIKALLIPRCALIVARQRVFVRLAGRITGLLLGEHGLEDGLEDRFDSRRDVDCTGVGRERAGVTGQVEGAAHGGVG